MREFGRVGRESKTTIGGEVFVVSRFPSIEMFCPAIISQDVCPAIIGRGCQLS